MTARSRLARLAVPLAAVTLAVTVVAAPVLAATTGAGTTAAPGLTADNGRLACLDAWVTVTGSRTVDNLKAAGTCEVDRRLRTLSNLGDVIKDAAALTDDHQAALQAILDGSASGLTSLKATIAGDTTVAALRTDIGKIFSDYRIYALVTRQVWLVTASDAAGSAAARLADTSTQLAALIDQAQADGKDVTEAQSHLDAMNTAVSAAQGALDGLAAKVLPLTPADWNAGTAGPILAAARGSMTTARGELRTALAEARQVMAALR